MAMRREFYIDQRNWLRSVLTDDRLSHPQRVVASAWMIEFLNRKTECAHVSAEKLAMTVGVVEKTVQRTFKKLLELGYIVDAGYFRRAKRYQAVLGPQCPKSTGRKVESGLYDHPVRTPGSSECGHGSPTNHSLEPSDPVSCEFGEDTRRDETPAEQSKEELSPFQQSALIDRLEEVVRLRAGNEQALYCLSVLSDQQKIELGMAWEARQIEDSNLIDAVQSRATRVREQRQALSLTMRRSTSDTKR